MHGHEKVGFQCLRLQRRKGSRTDTETVRARQAELPSRGCHASEASTLGREIRKGSLAVELLATGELRTASFFGRQIFRID